MTKIKYRDGYKYQLVEDCVLETCIRPPEFIYTAFIRLDTDGVLSIKAGYAWDGPSGPTIDTKDFMRGSLGHDALYQLMRDGLLDQSWREAADQELVRWCAEDGMPAIRRAWVYAGVRLGGGGFAATGPRSILEAP